MAAVNKYKSVLNKADFAKEQFDGVIARSQRMLLDGAITLIKELETDEKGYIKQSIANMRRIAQIKSRLHKIAENKEYQRGIRSLLTTFDSIYDQSKAYYDDEFRHKSIGARTADRALVVKQLAADNTIEGLAGAGLKSNVTDKLADIITRSVTTGARYADLVKDMHAHLEGDGGLLARYAKTYTTTAMSQYVGQVNKMMTDGIDAEWFMYIGSNIETTREFCQHLSKKKWVHISEIPEIIKGHIDGYECHIYEKTGLPDGMIEGTTEENFQVNVGGWNCGHALVPVSKLAVPEDIRRRFEQGAEPQQTDYERFIDDYAARLEELRKICLLAGDMFMDEYDAKIIANKDAAYGELETQYNRIRGYAERSIESSRQGYEAIKTKIFAYESDAQKFNATDALALINDVRQKYNFAKLKTDDEVTKEYHELYAIEDKVKAAVEKAINIAKEAAKIAKKAKAEILKQVAGVESAIGEVHAFVKYDKNADGATNAKNINEAVKLYVGEEWNKPQFIGTLCDRVKYGSITASSVKYYKGYLDKGTTYHIESINRHATLVDEAETIAKVMPALFVGRFNELIKKINACDIKKKGYQAVEDEINEAYNIYMLAKNSTAAKYGYDRISTKMPENIIKDFMKYFADGELPAKEFFDGLDEFIPLIREGDGHYDPSLHFVSIAAGERIKTPSYAKRIFYHEYGHAKDHTRKSGKWKNDPLLTNLFDKWKAKLTGREQELRKVVNAKFNEIDGFNNKNEWELLGALADTLQALFGSTTCFDHMGHPGTYFMSREKQLAEFIAHMSENRWAGNKYFKELFPEMYDEMIDVCKKLEKM